jgi:hypothetical protein
MVKNNGFNLDLKSEQTHAGPVLSVKLTMCSLVLVTDSPCSLQKWKVLVWPSQDKNFPAWNVGGVNDT